MMTYVVAGAAAVLGIQGLLLWRFLRVTKDVRRCDDRLAHFGDALALLTETAESGFQAVAAEVSRLSTRSTGTAQRTTTRRVATAARRGRSVPEIAAAEQVSEGEVRLRLHLSDQPGTQEPKSRAGRKPHSADMPRGADHGALRA